MSLIVKMRKQKAVYWKRLPIADKYGRFAFYDPVEISCRWEDSAQEFLDSQGEKQVSKAVVYVDRIVSPGDRLLRGEMDSATLADPLAADTFEVRRFDQMPNLKATEFLLTAYL